MGFQKMKSICLLASLAASALASPVVQREAQPKISASAMVEKRQAPPNHNDFSCKSTTHPNPVSRKMLLTSGSKAL